MLHKSRRVLRSSAWIESLTLRSFRFNDFPRKALSLCLCELRGQGHRVAFVLIGILQGKFSDGFIKRVALSHVSAE